MLRTLKVVGGVALLAACRPQGSSTPPAAVSTASVAAARTSATPPSTGPGEPAAPRDPGALVYGEHCAQCHGEPGKGIPQGRANDLANQDFLTTASDAFLLAAVERGRPGTDMPAYRGETPILEPEQSQAVVKFVRSWQKEPSVEFSDTPVRGDPKLGKKLYASRCSGCHGTLGEGATALSLNNPVFLETVTDGFLRHAIANGRRDTAMEAFGNKLSAQQIDHLVATIRSWSPGHPSAPHDS